MQVRRGLKNSLPSHFVCFRYGTHYDGCKAGRIAASLRGNGRATNKERLSQQNCGCDEPLYWFVIYCLKRLRTTAAQVGMLLNLRNNHITDSKHNYSSPSFVLSFLNALALYIKSDRAE